MTDEPTAKFPRIRIEGGPSAESIRIFRDGVLLSGVLEWQINGGNEQPVTAIFKEFIVFDGQVDLLPPRRRGPLDA